MSPGRHKLPFPGDGCCPPPHAVVLSPPFLTLFSGAREPALVVEKEGRLEGSSGSR